MPIPVPGRIAELLRRSTAQVRSSSREENGHGSAVVLTNDQAVTNAHVVRSQRLMVESWEGTTLPASVVKVDRRRDLALLSVPGLQAPPACLGDSDQLKVGSPVVAVGNPLGFVGAVSSGIVHSIGTAGPISRLPWIHADVRLAPGNSGGPLADLQGRVVGINTMVISGGLALAIPSRAVQSFLTRTSEGRSLGVVVRPVQLRNRAFGMLILEVVPGGAAEAASLLPGDILVGGNGQRFRFLDDLQMVIDQAPDSLLYLDFYRGSQEMVRHVAVKLVPERLQTAA
jgi:serine protease Do